MQQVGAAARVSTPLWRHGVLLYHDSRSPACRRDMRQSWSSDLFPTASAFSATPLAANDILLGSFVDRICTRQKRKGNYSSGNCAGIAPDFRLSSPRQALLPRACDTHLTLQNYEYSATSQNFLPQISEKIPGLHKGLRPQKDTPSNSEGASFRVRRMHPRNQLKSQILTINTRLFVF